MTSKEFKKWLQRSSELTENQFQESVNYFKGCASTESHIPQAITRVQLTACPHCGHDGLGKWGRASGLPRWRCKACGKTFNALTKTPLARLRKKDKWLTNAKAMIEGQSVRKTAKACKVHNSTAFRWRHRFLKLQHQAQCSALSGIAESDVTYFYRSEKGSKNLKRKPRKRGGDGIGKGFSYNLVSVITVRDRTGKGAERVALDQCQLNALDLYKSHLKPDTLLLTDGDWQLCGAARSRNPQAHQVLKGSRSRGEKGSPYHIQTVNGFHSHLKRWMTRFHGVATKYLPHYLGWHRHLVEGHHQHEPNLFIRLAFRPLSMNQQLTLT